MTRRHATACASALVAIGLLPSVAAVFPQGAAANAATTLPQALSETGLFRDLVSLTPARGVVPYDVNVPLWSDGARTRRWIVLPSDGSNAVPSKDRIIVKPGLPWAFPAGSVFVQHFDWALDDADPARVKKLQTQVLVIDRQGEMYGLAYKWNAAGTDALLLQKDDAEMLRRKHTDGSVVEQRYDYAGPDQCAVCHNQSAGPVLGVNYRQISRSMRYGDHRAIDQFVAWNSASMLSKSLDEPKALAPWNLIRTPTAIRMPFWSVPQAGRLTPIDDASASLEERARSYIDANCSSCHIPAVMGGGWDARSTVPLSEQGLVDAPARVAREGASVIVKAGVPEESLLYVRMATDQPGLKMPPLGRNAVDHKATQVIADWIRSLPGTAQRSAPRAGGAPER